MIQIDDPPRLSTHRPTERTTPGAARSATTPEVMTVENLHASYGDVAALKGIHLSLPRGSALALIGPSGCGKTTFLRTLNRMNDLIPGFSASGRICVDGIDVYDPEVDVTALRRRVGMVFQRPNPFPLSILDNVTWAMQGLRLSKRERRDRAVESLKRVGLWNEVKDRLHDAAFRLSGGQQQRLCIARAIAVRPAVLLMDEPTSALDPISAGIIEELMMTLKDEFTVIFVSHNLRQAARVSDRCAFFLTGELVEYGPTADMFRNPRDPRTRDYISTLTYNPMRNGGKPAAGDTLLASDTAHASDAPRASDTLCDEANPNDAAIPLGGLLRGRALVQNGAIVRNGTVN